MKRRTLPVATALAATTCLLLTGCGGGDGSKNQDKIAGADSGDAATSSSPSPSSGSMDRPDMTLPGDVKETFEGWKTGDAAKGAVLADAGRAQTAVTYAVTQGNPNSSALAFYQSGSALPGSQDWVKSIADSDLTYAGPVRYNAVKIGLFNEKSAAVSYCADETKAFNRNRKTQKVDRAPPTDDSYVLYSTRLELNSKDVWQTTKLESQRGNKACTA
ncbi:hypothetical protein [Streptomyces sp. NPDC058424]|uniref:hypothetical protein n=1 Tax=Streptomyces sp. NPDC058424 TaxID=3346491 RepID=UPI003664FEFB